MTRNEASPALRHELHFGDRVVRCFAERPAHIDALLKDVVRRYGERPALALGDVRLTYRDLDGLVDAVAGNLVSRGFRKGERIALLLGNAIEFVVCLLACARIGVICVPMNTRQRRPEIHFVLDQCKAAGLVCAAELAPELPERATLPHLRAVFVVGGAGETGFDVLTRPSRPSQVEIAEDDPALLLYTSGTTGKPKGAILTHLGILHSLLHFKHAFDLTESDVAVLAVPASHVTGVVAVILATIGTGGCVVLMPDFKARAFIELAGRERMTYAIMVPAMYNLCLLDPAFASSDLASWRIGGFGGAPMPEATIARLDELLPGLSLVNAYGATETTSPATILPVGDVARRPDSVGKPVACGDIIIVDDEGREVAPGTAGEIWIAGPMVVPGYWKNPHADKTSFAGGYWRSGDIGSKDAEGYVRVFDRKKDMINRAGFKVYSVEVENVLSHHPGVIECAILGRPDPVLGERVEAFVVHSGAPPDVHELKAFCAARLSDYKVPDFFTFRIEPLPRNANGKVLKAALRAAPHTSATREGSL